MTKTGSIWVQSLLVGLLSLVGVMVFLSIKAGVSVGIGMALALTNFWLLERLVKEVVKAGSPNKRRLIAMIVAKGIVFFGILGFVVMKVPIEAGPLLLGLSCVVGGIVLEGIKNIFVGQSEGA